MIINSFISHNVGVAFLERIEKRGLFITWIAKNNFDYEKNIKEGSLQTEGLINFSKFGILTIKSS